MAENEGFQVSGQANNAPDGISCRVDFKDPNDGERVLLSSPVSVSGQRYSVDLPQSVTDLLPDSIYADIVVTDSSGIERTRRLQDGGISLLSRRVENVVGLIPAAGATLESSSQEFTITPYVETWTYGFWIGSVNDIDSANAVYGDSGGLRSSNVISTDEPLPVDGRTVYVRVAINKNDGSEVSFTLFPLVTHTSSEDTFDTTAEGGVWTWLKVTDKTDTSNNNGHRVPQYSSVNAFNADKTRFSLPIYNGGVFNVETLEEEFPNTPFGYRNGVLGGTSGLSGTQFWDKDDPYKLFGIKENESRLISIDIRTPTVETLIYEAGSTSANIAGRTGRPDADQVYVTIDVGNEVRVVRIADGVVIRTQTAVGTLDFSSMSHTGAYFCINSSGDIRFYNTQTGALVSTSGDSNHGDFCIDDDGTEYFMTVGWPPRLFNIATGQLTSHGTLRTYGHGCGLVPGMQYISSDGAARGDGPWELPIGGDWDDAVRMGNLPEHIPPTFAASQMKITVEKTGEYALAVISNPQNVPNTYLGRKTFSDD